MTNEYKWEEEIRYRCHCGHQEKNKDLEENKFLRFDEELHSEERFNGRRKWMLLRCPKCHSLIVEEI